MGSVVDLIWYTVMMTMDHFISGKRGNNITEHFLQYNSRTNRMALKAHYVRLLDQNIQKPLEQCYIFNNGDLCTYIIPNISKNV